MPRLSICIPTYCQTEFLRATLLSVHAQDFSDYELIISDDSPGDSVAELVALFDFGGRLALLPQSRRAWFGRGIGTK